MKNYPNEAHIPYGGYRGATTAEAFEVPKDLQEGFPESYHPPSNRGYQQQEQLYGSQQSYFEQTASCISPYEKISMGMRTPAAGWLSYLGGWITGLIFLLLKRENRFVRFHAMQSLLFFGAIGIVTTVFSHIPLLASIGVGLGFVSFICWISVTCAATSLPGGAV